jgi:3',5'-cyclic AMP phosphodiesterase CpdA
VVPGNHDVSWWASPFGLRGEEPYAKYRRYFGEALGPVLSLEDAVIVGTVSANGLAAGSVTWNPRDLTVKGHLPAAETDRAGAAFAAEAPAKLRVVVLHHNVLRGRISNRWGLAHPHDAQRRLAATGADLVLCGHDHEEAVGPLDGGTVVAASSTHTPMTRGKRPSVFNLIRYGADGLTVRYLRWDGREFQPAEEASYPRRRGRDRAERAQGRRAADEQRGLLAASRPRITSARTFRARRPIPPPSHGLFSRACPDPSPEALSMAVGVASARSPGSISARWTPSSARRSGRSATPSAPGWTST